MAEILIFVKHRVNIPSNSPGNNLGNFLKWALHGHRIAELQLLGLNITDTLIDVVMDSFLSNHSLDGQNLVGPI